MTLPADTESVEYQIRLDAIIALQNLAELTTATKSFNTQMEAATVTTKNFAQQWGMSFQQAKTTLAGVDKEISGTAESSVVFGAKGQDAWNKVGSASEKASSTMVGGINLVRTAMHILVATGIFAVINAFQQLFSMAIKGLRELETATYNLVNAERTLSEQGVAITPQGLDETIKKLQQIDPLLSKIQATEVVSRAATLVAPNVGFNAKEIDEFSQAVAVLAVRNKGLGKSFEEVESQVSNAFLSGRVSVGINQLGVKITDQIVKDEALRMGLVKSGDEFDKLTGKMQANVKARAMLSVITQNTQKEISHLPEYFKTADAKFGIFQARMQDVFTKVGTLLAPILIKFFDVMIKGLEKASAWLDKNEKSLTLMANAAAQLIPIFVGIISFVMKFVTAIGWGLQLFSYFIGRMSALIDKIPLLKKLVDALSFKEIGDYADTATNSVQEFGNTATSTANKVVEANNKMKESLADLAKEAADKLADIERNYRQKLADIATSTSDKIEDASRKGRNARLDAERDLGSKLADIGRTANENIASAQQDFRQKEIDREKEKNDKLKELRQKFLMDLEDALRERDARAVLKLIRNYQNEKKQAEEANKQKAQQDRQELARKMQDIELERQQKVEAARQEYADKLKEIELAQQREYAEINRNEDRELRDAQTAHQRQLEEQRIYLQRKLRDLADALAKEYNLTAQGSAAILKVMQSYLNASGTLLSGTSGQFGTSFTAPSATSDFASFGQKAGIGTGLYNPYDVRSRKGFAEGGTLLATRPTTVTFGETPEIATFTPITRQGLDTNKLFASGAGTDKGGTIDIALKLSPDLKAEILDTSLENVAIHLERLSRSE